MRDLIFIFVLIWPAVCQVNIVNHPVLASYTSSAPVAAVELNADQNEAYLLLCQSPYKVVHLDISSPGGPTVLGEFLTTISFNSSYYGWIYIVKDYMIVSVAANIPMIFNLTTYQKLGDFSQFGSFLQFRTLKYVKSKNIIVYSDRMSRVFYSNVSAFPYPSIVQISNINVLWSAFIDVSVDESYISVTYANSVNLLLYNLTDFTLVRNLTTPCNFNNHIWSPDSRYVALFPACSLPYIIVYDRNQSWAESNKTVNQYYARFAFNYFQTNTLIMVPQADNTLVSMNWYDFSITNYSVGAMSVKYGRASFSNQAFAVFTLNYYVLRFFVVPQYCTSLFPYSLTSKSCSSCPANCATCPSSTNCSVCAANYQIVNSTCQACGMGTFYNSLTLLCDSCPQDCFVCPSASVCTTCISNHINVNGSCQSCPIGTFFNSLSSICDSCPDNCFVCPSASTCSSCATNFQMSNGSCQTCVSRTFLNNLTSTCDNCSLNCAACTSASNCILCDADYQSINGTCSIPSLSLSVMPLVCPSNCIQCVSSTKCTACDIGYSLLNGSCVLVQNQLLQGTLDLTLDNQVLKFANKIPGSRIVMSQAFSFFVNIDHLWLYIYHKSQYSYTINSFLKAVNKFQQQKWSTLDKEDVYSKFLISTHTLENDLNIKLNQTSVKYYEIEQQSRSFFNSTVNFFLLNLPLVLVMFLFFKIIFYLTFNYKFSALFREYSFNLFLFLMLLQGNIESFTYLIMSDFSELISDTNNTKIINVCTLSMGFWFFTVVFGGQIFIFMAYETNIKYFLKGLKANFKGIFFRAVDVGLLNFGLGTCHILLEDDEPLQLLMLAIVESFYLCLLAVTLKSRNIHERRFAGWQFAMATFMRIVLIVTFMMAQDNDEAMEILMNQIHSTILFMYLMNWIGSIFVEYCFLAEPAVKFVISKIYALLQTRQGTFAMTMVIPQDKLQQIKNFFESQPNLITKRKFEKNATVYESNPINIVKTTKDAKPILSHDVEAAQVENFQEAQIPKKTMRRANKIKIKGHRKEDTGQILNVNSNSNSHNEENCSKEDIETKESPGNQNPAKKVMKLVNLSSKLALFSKNMKKKIELKKSRQFMNPNKQCTFAEKGDNLESI